MVPVSAPRWFTLPKTVTHPGTNRAWRRVTTLIETSVIPLSQTGYRSMGSRERSQGCRGERETSALIMVYDKLSIFEQCVVISRKRQKIETLLQRKSGALNPNQAMDFRPEVAILRILCIGSRTLAKMVLIPPSSRRMLRDLYVCQSFCLFCKQDNCMTNAKTDVDQTCIHGQEVNLKK